MAVGCVDFGGMEGPDWPAACGLGLSTADATDKLKVRLSCPRWPGISRGGYSVLLGKWIRDCITRVDSVLVCTAPFISLKKTKQNKHFRSSTNIDRWLVSHGRI